MISNEDYKHYKSFEFRCQNNWKRVWYPSCYSLQEIEHMKDWNPSCNSYKKTHIYSSIMLASENIPVKQNNPEQYFGQAHVQ